MTDPYSQALVESTRSAVRPWLRRITDDVIARQGLSVPDELVVELVESLGQAVDSEMTALLATDVERQRRNPLDVFRSAAVEVSQFLVAQGAGDVDRDEFMRRAFPDDRCGLAPAAWADIDESMTNPGIEWGAFKAATIMSRHKPTP